MTIVCFFSIILFISLEKNTHTILRKDLITHDFLDQEQLVFREKIDDIENTIFSVDLILLFIVIGLGYIIAGKTLQPIKESLESQQRFLADVSHDLRTPLAIMKSESQVLIQNTSHHIKDYKKVILSNLEEINTMARLVDDLLIVARTDDLHHNKILEKIDIYYLLKKLVSKMELQATNKNISLTLKEFTPLFIYGTSHTLERAFQNIIQNAINYTLPSGTITLVLNQEKNWCIVEIIDTGVGITKQDLPYVFDRFFKAEHSRNDKSGSGLGLPIAKQIIEEHRGKITITSTSGVGTLVSLKIPTAGI